MDQIIAWFQKERTKLYLTLILLIFILFEIRGFLPIVLFTTIFSFLAVKATKRLKKMLPINQVFATIIVYLLLIIFLSIAISYITIPLIHQLSNLPHLVGKVMHGHPEWNHQINVWVHKAIKNQSFVRHGQVALLSGLKGLESIGTGFSHVVVALFLSFVFTASYNKMRDFGKRFLESPFKTFFGNIYHLVSKFVLILGAIIDTQLIICTINTILMIIGLYLLKMPSWLVLGVMCFILGLIPVAGTLLSMIPLLIVALASGGWIKVIEVLILVTIIHLFESYVLHPRLMANATDLPVFVTFITLIVSEHLLGVWGLIVGLPIVAFFLDLFGVHSIVKKRE